MSTFFHFLAQQGGVLLAAATCLLAVGSVGVAVQRSPIHRQRAGEVAILGVLAALFLACVPLPRYRVADLWTAHSAARDPVRPTQPAAIPPPVFSFQDQAVLAEVMVEEEVPPIQSDVFQPEISTTAQQRGATVPVFPDVPVFPGPPVPATAVEPEPLADTEVIQRPVQTDRATATPGRSVSAAPAVDVRYPLAIAYVAGALACLAWLALGRGLLLRMLRSARPPEPWLENVYRRLPYARTHRPRLVISDRCARALSFGIWRPTIVLPSDGCRADRAGALRHVLLHELAHIRQRDGWGHLLFNLAFPLLYFHPLYWWIRSRSYLAAELIADDWAAPPAAKESYVEVLIGLAKRGGRPRFSYANSTQIFGSRSQFYRRMQMLLNRETRLTRRCSPLWRLIYPTACLATVLLVAGTLGVRPAEAQSEEVLPPAEPSPAVEEIPAEVPTPIEPAAAESPAAEEVLQELPSVEPAAAEPPAAEETSKPPARAKPRQQIALQAERDQLRLQLKALEASVRSLSQMVESLRAQQTIGQAGGAASFAGSPWTPDPGLRTPQKGVPPLPPAQTKPPTYNPGAIPAGYQAFQVKVDPATGRKLRPNARVDLIPPSGYDGEPLPQDVPWVANASSPDFKQTAVLLVTSEQAKTLTRAAAQGKIGLRIRKTSRQPTAPAVSGPIPSLRSLPSPVAPSAPTLVPSEPVLPTPITRQSRPASTRRVTSPLGSVAERRAPQGTRLDLVRLATSYADVVGELEIAKLELEGRKELADRNVVPKQELAIAEIKFKTAQRKLTLLTDIAKSALMATEAEMAAAMKRLDWLKTNGPNDHPAVETSKSELIRAQSRLEILKSILGSAGR